jgi:hypothetical protein
MPGSNDFPARSGPTANEFLVGQHSLFFAGLGQAFFYLHLLSPYLAVWVAGPLLLAPWGVVFVLFYEERTFVSPRFLRRTWLACVAWVAALTVLAEVLWALGCLPKTETIHWLASIVLVQLLMNLGWLSIVPLIRDYRHNPKLWS